MTGGGITVNRFQQLFLLAISQGAGDGGGEPGGVESASYCVYDQAVAYHEGIAGYLRNTAVSQITIDNHTYELDTPSDEAKAQLTSLQFVDADTGLTRSREVRAEVNRRL